MKLGIVGQGAAALFLSLIIKNKNKNIEITIIDKNEKPFKKLYATGNGRCNLGNLKVNENSYNSMFAFNLVKEYNSKTLISFLNKVGVLTRNIDDLVYPYSLSAKALIDYLINYLKNESVEFINNEQVLDYYLKDNRYFLKTQKSEFYFDKVIIACGGCSSPNLGSDGIFFDVIKNHGYKINELKPGLVPIKIKENIKNIENERVKVLAKLYLEDKEVYQESGEVIFKKDALSGIVMMNFSSLIARSSLKNYYIKLDLFKDYTNEELYRIIKNDNKNDLPLLYGYFSKNLANYIYKEANIFNKNKVLGDFELRLLVATLKDLTFTFKELYPFINSQVSIGGVDIKEIDKNSFESLKEKNIYFLGEVLNLDGLCGGYNLMLCYSEARKCAENLLRII